MIRQHQFLQGGAGLDRASRAFGRRARAHDGLRRGGAEAPRPAVPRRSLLCTGDMGFSAQQDLRHRGLAAGPERLSRDFELLQLRRLPGAAHEGALPHGGREGHALRPHAQRLRPRGRPHAGRRSWRTISSRMARSPFPAALRPYMGGLESNRASKCLRHRSRSVQCPHPGLQRRRHPCAGHQGAGADRARADRRRLGRRARGRAERRQPFADAAPAAALHKIGAAALRASTARRPTAC